VGSSGRRLARAAPSNHAFSVAGGEWQSVEFFQWHISRIGIVKGVFSM